MKKTTLFLLLFTFSLPFFANAQKKLKTYVVSIQDAPIPTKYSLLFELEEDSITLIPYKYVNYFYKNTADERTEAAKKIKIRELEVELNKHSIYSLSNIRIKGRRQRMKNWGFGTGAGFLTGVLASVVFQSKIRNEYGVENEALGYFVVTASSTAIGSFIGLFMPINKVKIIINGNKQNYQTQKALLGKYAIIK